MILGAVEGALMADEGVRNPVKFGLVAGAERGDSGRGNDGRRMRGLGTEGGPTDGPTDLLKFVTEGRDGVGGVATVRFVTYLLLFMGTKIPAPGMEVVK